MADSGTSHYYSARPVPPKPQDAFQVRKQHLGGACCPRAIARSVLARAGDRCRPLLTCMAAGFRWWDAWGDTSSSRVHCIYASITEMMK